MVNQNYASLHIGQLNLRVPGKNAETGRRTANGLVEILALNIPAGAQHHIGGLSLRVPVAAGASDAVISKAVGDAIARALARTQRAPSPSVRSRK